MTNSIVFSLLTEKSQFPNSKQNPVTFTTHNKSKALIFSFTLKNVTAVFITDLNMHHTLFSATTARC